MKAVMKSVTPQICGKVASGDCTMLVSKTAPKCETPFKAYIYMTKQKPYKMTFAGGGKMLVHNGNVIGEFICDKVIKTCGWRLRGDTQQCAKRTTAEESFPELACLTIDEIVKYAESENREVCGLHISDLKIYDKPKELREFRKPLDSVWGSYCNDYCDRGCISFGSTDYSCNDYWNWEKGLTRAPSNWQYVEEL